MSLGVRKYRIGKELFQKLKYTSHDRPYLDGGIDFDDFETVLSHEQWVG